MKAIVNGKIILKDRIAEGCALLYSDKIEGILPMEQLPQDAQRIDARGGYVAPGLIDLHIHGFGGLDFCADGEEAVRGVSAGLVANGVTGYLPTTVTTDMAIIRQALEACRRLQQESLSWKGSTILGCHVEGPFINISKKGGQHPDYIIPPDVAFMKEYADVIRILTIAPEVDTADFAAIREICRDTDVILSMGHTDADYDTAMASTQAGVRHVTHLFNAMSPLSHREPGVVTAALNADVSCELIVDMFHVSPALYDLLWKLKGRKLCFITDCPYAGGMEKGEHVKNGSKIIIDDLCRMENGTICGSVLTLNKGVWNVYTHSSIPLWECVNGASLNPATVLGLDDKKGSLEVGKDADIFIADEEFCVQKTIIGGEIRYEA